MKGRLARVIGGNGFSRATRDVTEPAVLDQGSTVVDWSFNRVDRLAMGVVAAMSLGLFVAVVRLIEGDFLNSYPYISSDGFDWIYEGHALVARLRGEMLTPFAILRSPGFVLVTAADAWAGGRGIIVALVLATSVFVAHGLMVATGRWLRAPSWLTALFVTASLVTTMGFYRVWVLADGLAVALMIVSVWAMVRYRQREHHVGSLVIATCGAVLAGLTQTYTLIAFLTGVVVFSAEALVEHRRLRADLLAAGLAAVIGTSGVLWLWRLGMPHEDTPSQFVLLALSFRMGSYYAKLWSFVLVPFLPLLLAAGLVRVFRHAVVAYLWTTVAAFATLSFLYQWPDSRFTAIYVPVLTLATVAVVGYGRRTGMGMVRGLADPVDRLAAATAIFVLAQGLVVAPQSDWGPSWAGAELAPRQTWLGEVVLHSGPVDRFGLRQTCGSTVRFCEGVSVPGGYDPYATRIMNDYLAYQRGARASP